MFLIKGNDLFNELLFVTIFGFCVIDLSIKYLTCVNNIDTYYREYSGTNFNSLIMFSDVIGILLSFKFFTISSHFENILS